PARIEDERRRRVAIVARRADDDRADRGVEALRALGTADAALRGAERAREFCGGLEKCPVRALELRRVERARKRGERPRRGKAGLELAAGGCRVDRAPTRRT